MKKIIGLTGAAGCGKNTAANFLWCEGQVKEMAFADPLYEAVAAITGVCVGTLKQREFKEATIPWIGKSPRFLLQTLGTEWGRQIVSQSLWIDHLRRRLETAEWWQGVERDVCITDVRFDNEAQMIKEMGGEVWRIVREGRGCRSHSSEAGVSDRYIDVTIDNSGTKKEFHLHIMDAYRREAEPAKMK